MTYEEACAAHTFTVMRFFVGICGCGLDVIPQDRHLRTTCGTCGVRPRVYRGRPPCKHCFAPAKQHADSACLFFPTKYAAVTQKDLWERWVQMHQGNASQEDDMRFG